MDKRNVFVAPPFGRKVKKLKKQEKKELDDAALELLDDPSIGEAKVGDLAGVWVYKFKIKRQLILLSYTYDEKEINLLTFGSHQNFYKDLKNYRKA